MSSEIRANLISSRAGLSTVTMTDSGPMFSGITTFVDNSGFTFGVGGGTSIFTPATNVLTLGTNNTEKVRIDANGNTNITGVTTAANFKTGVSNLHNLGLTLSGGQLDVGSNIKIGTAGVVTATSFVGDGSALTGISAGGFSPDAQGNLIAGTNAGANFSGTNPVHNILIGYEAGNALTTADYSVAIGYHALKSADTESYNVAIGYNALKELTGMGGNVAVGYQAGYYTYNMYECVAVGYNAMSKPVQSGVNTWYSVAVGANAMGSCGGDRCTAVGHEALEGNNAGIADDNTAIGHQSLTNLLSNGLKNTAVGTFSGKGTTSGDENVYIGYNAGNDAHATGSNCIIIGNDAAASSTSVSNEITLGDANITKFRIPGLNYTNDAGKVGIGYTVPNAKLHIASGTGVAVGDATNPALQIGGTTNYRFAVHTTNEQAIIANKNGDDGIAFHTKTGTRGSFGEAVRIKSDGRVSVGATFGLYNSSTQNSYGGSALFIDLTNETSTDLYTTMVRLRGGSSGYVHASLNLCATSSENASGNYRGLGIYMNDEAANNEWYAGRPYASSNQYMISYVGTVNAPYAASASTGNAKLTIQTNGNYNFSGSNTSDRDLKENITTLSGTSLDKIIQLTPKTFNFIPQICETPEGYPSPPPTETPETKTGFIAQEVQSVIPSIINGTDGQKDMGIDYNGLIAHMVNAIKEQQQQIEVMKQENIALRVRVTNLEDK